MTDQRADLEWREGGVPVSRHFDDPYFSLDNGVAETQHVFLGGNALPSRFRDGFHIGELGFGTGLNFLVTLAAWRGAAVPGRLRFTSFEAFPMQVTEMLDALRVYPDMPSDVVAEYAAQDVLPSQITGPDFDLNIVYGDAREALPAWDGEVDAWYLDGFSPAKNPELWEASLLAEVGLRTAVGGTFATYTAAGFVRRGLEAAGFDVVREPGFGRKRHMTRGVKV